MSDAFQQITENHSKRHLHANRNKRRCTKCGNFLPIPDGSGEVRTQCNNCGLWQLLWIEDVD